MAESHSNSPAAGATAQRPDGTGPQEAGSSMTGLCAMTGLSAATGLCARLGQQPVLRLGLIGSLLMWLAMPPASLGLLAWVAPVPWLLLVRRVELGGRRPYRVLWFAGFVFWFLSLHWLRLPHPATFLGWFALAFYLAFYLPLFVGASRIAVHSLKVPLFVAAPVVWTGLELVRAHLLSGFLMAELAHTQLGWPWLLQIADLGGSYALDFTIVLTAACLARAWPLEGESLGLARLFSLAPAVVLLPLVLIYGHRRMLATPASDSHRGPTVALIQGNIAVDWKQDATKQQEIIAIYTRLSREAVQQAEGEGKRLDLIVWPETMYRDRVYYLADDFSMQGASEPLAKALGGSRESLERQLAAGAPLRLAQLQEQVCTPLLVGIEVGHLHSLAEGDFDRHNGAVALDRLGAIVGRYEKTHLVMFGEYVPFADWIPGLYRLTPLSGGLVPGKSPVSIGVEGFRYAPNICYESVLPHLIRRHVLELTQQGEAPDVLVNMTNDAWYHGSSELDMHLACSVFRAIECRKPVLIAANTGLTASIDANGQIRSRLLRDEENVLLCSVALEDRPSWYLVHGDWFAGSCLGFTLLFLLAGLRFRSAGSVALS